MKIEQLSIGDLAAKIPGAVALFEKYKIDYCCGGAKRLAEVSTAAGVPLERLVAELEEFSQGKSPEPHQNWQTQKLTSLIDYIVQKHHRYLRAELPSIEVLFRRICSEHGERRPELYEMERVFLAMKSELENHMLKEEQILFPYVARLENLSGGFTHPPFGTVQNPIRVMMLEHEDAARALDELRLASGGYLPPADACASYRLLYEKLETLERDLHRHVHLENNILFPAAMALEDSILRNQVT